MKLYPLMLNIENKLAVIIGGGEVAFRKAKDLLESNAEIRLISPEIKDEIYSLRDEYIDKFKIINREYKHGDLENASLVYSAANNDKVNKEVFIEAEEKNIFINAVDDPQNCSFFVPSLVRKDNLIIAVSTSGASPSMAGRLRRSIEQNLPENIADNLDALNVARTILKEDPDFKYLTSPMRGQILKMISYDDNQLSLMTQANSDNSLKDFLKDIISKIND